MTKLRWMIAAAALALGTTGAQAQYGNPMGRGIVRPGGLADSARALDAQNPIAMLLEHSGDLSLSSDQTNRIAAIKQRLNAQQRPLIAELDSLRAPGQPHLDPASMSTTGRDSAMARHRAVADVMAQVRTLQLAARTEAWALLTPDQQKKAGELESKLRDGRRRGRDDQGGRDGRGMSGDRGNGQRA